MRKSTMNRKTTETDISLSLNIDGSGNYEIKTGCGFFDHMMELFARHGHFDLQIKCTGDTQVDCHHTVEDIGIVLGSAFREALGDKKGIARYGSKMLPMDEALILCALDISGRAFLNYDAEFNTEKVGDFDVQLVEEFLTAFCRELGLTLHIMQLAGVNTHHIIEAIFKGLARALAEACALLFQFADQIPSTKGVL